MAYLAAGCMSSYRLSGDLEGMLIFHLSVLYYGLMVMAMLGHAPALAGVNGCIAPDNVMRLARICRIPTAGAPCHTTSQPLADHLLPDLRVHVNICKTLIPLLVILSQLCQIQVSSLWDGMEPFFLDNLSASNSFLNCAAYQ